MAALSIRNLDDRVRDRLRVRAARHGRSMEAEARVILEAAVREPDHPTGLFPTLLDRFGELGGIHVEPPARTTPPRSPDLGR